MARSAWERKNDGLLGKSIVRGEKRKKTSESNHKHVPAMCERLSRLRLRKGKEQNWAKNKEALHRFLACDCSEVFRL